MHEPTESSPYIVAMCWDIPLFATQEEGVLDSDIPGEIGPEIYEWSSSLKQHLGLSVGI